MNRESAPTPPIKPSAVRHNVDPILISPLKKGSHPDPNIATVSRSALATVTVYARHYTKTRDIALKRLGLRPVSCTQRPPSSRPSLKSRAVNKSAQVDLACFFVSPCLVHLVRVRGWVISDAVTSQASIPRRSHS
eukprot:scaffold107507_cov69-Phaeocystis_antarctica.AAC.2